MLSLQVYQALLVGTVPIYIGAPNVDELLPCTNCIIKTTDFASPAALATHLQYLVQNPRYTRTYPNHQNSYFLVHLK
jgi:hypothetical protein